MTKIRSLLRAMLCGVFALLFAAVWTQSAHAYTWARGVTLYNGPGLCVQGDAGIDHARPNVFSGNLAYGNAYALTQGCGTGLTKPASQAGVQVHVFRWNGSEWQLCRSSDWKFGPTGQTGGDLGSPYGPSIVFDYGGSASCGPGSYGAQAHVMVWDGSQWREGHVWSGAETVP
ncbi:hypothetical protein [Streptomyces telluris]|uniref:Secreted protein n=1 Tax=Streptomyces telluris TaxID=2720021 RepID=A0A9X2LNA8_9ACTN|nr:hypothetical protein [Streptomyces telluris]MCQ8774398.1 hypothetical protein [Streptomyces telluris]NJP82472.1 hypothetical protein [Streptomyces telluris]